MKNFFSYLFALLIYLAVALFALQFFYPMHKVDCYQFNEIKIKNSAEGIYTKLDIPENGSKAFWACNK